MNVPFLLTIKETVFFKGISTFDIISENNVFLLLSSAKQQNVASDAGLLGIENMALFVCISVSKNEANFTTLKNTLFSFYLNKH